MLEITESCINLDEENISNLICNLFEAGRNPDQIVLRMIKLLSEKLSKFIF